MENVIKEVLHFGWEFGPGRPFQSISRLRIHRFCDFQ